MNLKNPLSQIRTDSNGNGSTIKLVKEFSPERTVSAMVSAEWLL